MEINYAALAEGVAVELEEARLLAHRATGRHIAGMTVAGREVVRAGAVLGVDLPGIERELDAQVRHGVNALRSWQEVCGRVRTRLGEFYAAGLHCG